MGGGEGRAAAEAAESAETARTESSRSGASAASPSAETATPLTVAAVDLGSNSFHMVVGRFSGEDLVVLDRMKESVRLAAGLDASGRLAADAQERALACLERFGQRLRGIPSEHVRVVGTNTLRRARDAREVRARLEAVLGHPIEVVSGQEEARLIYSGVAHSVHADASQRLVVDIGGGSTEVIIGEGFEVLRAHSLFMGCVTFSREHFPDGKIGRAGFRAAETAALLELNAIRVRLRALGWEGAIGASGTIQAVRDILRANDWGHDAITLTGLKRLRKAMVEAGDASRLALDGLKEERAPVLPGGLAILIALFKGLAIEAMTTSGGALREGVLYDLVGRIRHGDARERTIRRLVDQYHVDLDQAARVERTALGLLRQVEGPWELDASARKYLVWASRLHEVGLAVSYTGYHKHGAYLVQWSDMPGFSSDDQQMVAALIRTHRRKISADLFEAIGPGPGLGLRRLALLLRLAVLLNRGRASPAGPIPRLKVGDDALAVGFIEGWIEKHPLTAADLEQEKAFLAAVGVKLEVRTERGKAAGDRVADDAPAEEKSQA